MATIFIAVFCNELSIALRTFVLSSAAPLALFDLGVSGAEQPTTLGLWLCYGHFQKPFFPTNLFISSPAHACQPSSLSSLLFEKLNGNLTPHSTVRSIRRRQLMYQRSCACINESLYLWGIGNVGKGDIKVGKVAKRGADGGEVSVEEDGMKNS